MLDENEIVARVRSRFANENADEDLFTSGTNVVPGKPVRVVSREGMPVYWIVPLAAENEIVGMATVSVSGTITSVSAFQNEAGNNEYAGFFHTPPLHMLDDISRSFNGATLSKPVMSYDRTPERWGWMVEVRTEPPVRVFIVPGGWSVCAEGAEYGYE